MFRFGNGAKTGEYTGEETVVWQSNAPNSLLSCRTMIHDDGNVVIVHANGNVIWASETNSIVSLRLDDDGILRGYNSDSAVVWSRGNSGTLGPSETTACNLDACGPNFVLKSDVSNTPCATKRRGNQVAQCTVAFDQSTCCDDVQHFMQFMHSIRSRRNAANTTAPTAPTTMPAPGSACLAGTPAYIDVIEHCGEDVVATQCHCDTTELVSLAQWLCLAASLSPCPTPTPLQITAFSISCVGRSCAQVNTDTNEKSACGKAIEAVSAQQAKPATDYTCVMVCANAECGSQAERSRRDVDGDSSKVDVYVLTSPQSPSETVATANPVTFNFQVPDPTNNSSMMTLNAESEKPAMKQFILNNSDGTSTDFAQELDVQFATSSSAANWCLYAAPPVLAPAPTPAPTATPTAPPTPVCAAVKNARTCRTAGCSWTRNGNAKSKSCVGSGSVAVVAVDSVCKSFNAARKCQSNTGCGWARKGENKFKSCNSITNGPADLGPSAPVGSVCGSMTKHRKCRRNAQCRWVKTGIEKYKTCQPIAVAAPTLTTAPTPAPTSAAPRPTFSTGVCNAWKHYDGCCRRDYTNPQLETMLLVEMLVLSTATEANDICATKCSAHGDCTAYELALKKAKTGSPRRFRCELHADKKINSASKATQSCKNARCEVLACPRCE